MNLALWLLPTPGGLALAALAVIVGAPLFSDGLRALRLRRQLAGLRPGALEPSSSRLAQVCGRVALESPLFAPISGVPCAGFALEAHAVGLPLTRVVDERRAFRLVADGVSAHVPEDKGAWDLGMTGECEITANESLSSGLTALLERSPEALWWRRSGGTLHLIERALRSDAECHVVGRVRRPRAQYVGAQLEQEMLRTGTDGDIAFVATPVVAAAPDLWIDEGDPSDFMLVSDRAPDLRRFAVPLYRVAGVLIGPALGLAGMLYLASAADYLRSVGRF